MKSYIADRPVMACVLLTIIIGASTSVLMAAAPDGADLPSRQDTDRLAWWKDAKLGMFIHWGVYSQAGGEWNGDTNHAEWLQLTAKIPLAEYTRFARTFNPVRFDAEQWVNMAKTSGMKYLVITAKHHDGFAMYDSASNSHNIVEGTAFGRDPLKELSQACQKEGVRFCVYYSLGRDWEDPDVPTGSGRRLGWRSNLIDFPDEQSKDFQKYFERKVKPQVQELLTEYGPIGVLWFDTFERISNAQSEELIQLVRKLQPDCIINDRVGRGLGDYKTSEQEIPTGSLNKPWETCMTMNDHWGYNKADQNWKSNQHLLRNLVDIVSKGGNYLLNVGPTGDGEFPEPSVKRLRTIGQWLDVNGEAIYGCGPTPFGAEIGSYSETQKDSKGHPQFVANWRWRATTQPGKIYVHLFEWPVGALELPAIERPIQKVYRLADTSRKPIEYVQRPDKVSILLPETSLIAFPAVICLHLSEETP